MDIQSPLRGAETTPFTIPAGGQLSIAATGEFVRCISADANFEISFNSGPKVFMASGISRRTYKNQEFSSFELYNTTGSDIDVVLAWGYGDLEDGRLTVTGALNIAQASKRTHSAETVGLAAVKILDANAARKGWKVINNGTVPIFLGSDNTVTVANGEPLAVGAGAGWDDLDEIWAISGTADQDVRITEIE